MAQKVIKIGSSIGMTIPTDVARVAGFRVGDHIRIVRTKPGHIEFARVDGGKTSDTEVIEWAKEFVSKHLAAFKELADK